MLVKKSTTYTQFCKKTTSILTNVVRSYKKPVPFDKSNQKVKTKTQHTPNTTKKANTKTTVVVEICSWFARLSNGST